MTRWHLPSGQQEALAPSHAGEVLALAVSGDGGVVASLGEDRTLNTWSIASGTRLGCLRVPCARRHGLAIGDGGRRAVTLGGSELYLWGLCNEGSEATTERVGNAVVTVEMTPGSGAAVALQTTGTLDVWDAREGARADTRVSVGGIMGGVDLAPDGRHVVVAGRQLGFSAFELSRGSLRELIHDDGAWAFDCRFLAGGSHAVCARSNGTIERWHVGTGKRVCCIMAHRGKARCVFPFPDGRYAVSCGEDATLRVNDLESGSVTRTMCMHRDERLRAVTPDGRLAITAGRESELRAWDTLSGRCVVRIRSQKEFAGSAVVTPDGRRIITEERHEGGRGTSDT